MNKEYPIWHPFTQHGLGMPEIPIVRAEGAYLYTADGRRIIDAISSWWVNIHGHCHPAIVRAVQDQAERLEQVIFAGFTHEPAQALAVDLLRAVNESLCNAEGQGPLSRVFYSDSGSTAVEVALKMAIGYWEHTGRARRRILALDGGYHGDTFGAMSAGGRGVYNRLYEPFLFEVTHLPFPSTDGAAFLTALEDVLRGGGDEIAAFVFEPVVQGAAGFRIYGADILAQAAALCRAHDVLLIADEVMTGFGRTGTFLACEQAAFVPDILCLSKGLSGGFLPMGATLCAERIYKAFYDKDRARMFFHSSSFTGNALSCAAARASLALWREDDVQGRIDAVARAQAQAAQRFQMRSDLCNVRAAGTILAVDVVADDRGYLSHLAPQLYQGFLSRRVLLRPIGETVYILPPYCVTQKDLDEIYECINTVIPVALDGLRDGRKQQAL